MHTFRHRPPAPIRWLRWAALALLVPLMASAQQVERTPADTGPRFWFEAGVGPAVLTDGSGSGLGSTFNLGIGWHPLRDWAVGLEFAHVGDNNGCRYYDCGDGYRHLDVDVMRLSLVVERHSQVSHWRWRLSAGPADLCPGFDLIMAKCDWKTTLGVGAYATYHWNPSALSRWSSALRVGIETARFKPLAGNPGNVRSVHHTAAVVAVQLRWN